ncbi:MAG: methylase involved in ubiquinone/menaquinone biosynthesis [Planctomycetota bacterium]|nr:methylase involved in ubiquinone/menaquinone biosynthesis [Planctomycetota bacterium]
MPRSALVPPMTDPTPIFEQFRGSYGTELLTAAVAHLDVFGKLASPKSFESLRDSLGLADRPANVLITALRAMGLLAHDSANRLVLTDLAREHLVPGADFDVSGYIGLAANAPGVLEMVERLRTNRPAGASAEEQGAAFIFREGLESAMEREASARSLTLALAGRARNVAPHLARVAQLETARVLLDVGGGTGIYAIACVQAHPSLRAKIWDRPEVLKVAREMAESHGVLDRVELIPGDMFADPVPEGADAILLSNILHDWDVPECRTLVGRLAATLRPGGRLMVHDVFLDDDLSGPLPIALYSAALFTLTEGRAYSAAEYRGWLEVAGLVVDALVPTLIHCGVLTGTRPA